MPARAAVLVLLLVIVLGAASSGCATTHQVRPLGRGNAVVTASLGGPLVEVFGLVIPTPIGSVGGGYGLTDRLDLTLHLDVTAAAFGNVHLDPGVAWHPVVSEGGARPTLTLGGSVHVFSDFSSALVAPALMGAAAWRIARRHLVYAGVDAALAIRSETRPLIGPFAGAEARIGRRIGLALEIRWLAPWYDTSGLAPRWVAPSSQGYLSVLLGVHVYLGDVR